MARYIIRRFLSMTVALWMIITITFFLMHSIPGGPFTKEKAIPESIVQHLQEYYHLNDPIWKQYLDYLGRVIRWDLGPSFKYEGRSVNNIINEGFPVSAILGSVAIALSLLFGIPAGVISALKQNRWQDNIAMFFAILGVSIPNYVIAALLMYVFALKLHWLPAALWGKPSQVIMPALALAGLPTANIARLMRSSMLEVMSQDYIRTAKAKGLPDLIIIWRHALKNALIPIVTYLGPMIAAILTGSFVIENMFGIPGLGTHFVTSISNRDYTTILGVTVFYSILLLVMNFLVDIAYGFIDPRIQLGGGKR